jgi:hypothetical protein
MTVKLKWLTRAVSSTAAAFALVATSLAPVDSADAVVAWAPEMAWMAYQAQRFMSVMANPRRLKF